MEVNRNNDDMTSQTLFQTELLENEEDETQNDVDDTADFETANDDDFDEEIDEHFEQELIDENGLNVPVQTFADSRIRGNGTEESMRREEESHSYDRKLTRLIEQYPSIWCTMHPDYGNFEVTRKQWRTIAVHFKRSENIKLRWKNIRKRYVRIERRIEEGKRFTGYFDKATNFLSNRNLPPDQWKQVDCGVDDGDTFVRDKLDAIEEEMYDPKKTEDIIMRTEYKKSLEEPIPGRPIEVLPIDIKIINFVKRNAILWRRVSNDDPHHQYAMRNLWMQLWRSMSGISYDDMVYRWHYLYEMYKTFRLKQINNAELLASLELKYSKYLARLYFLYKIDEDIMRNECTMVNDDMYELDLLPEQIDCPSEEQNQPLMLSAPDDKAFALELVRTMRHYPALWNMLHAEYNDPSLRVQLWNKVAYKLARFNRDLKAIKLRWVLIKYNYYRYCRDRKSKCSPAPRVFRDQIPVEELKFLREGRFHR